MGDPVGRRETAPGNEHAVALVEHGGLVGDVQEAFLAQADVERATPERKGAGVAAHQRHPRRQPDVTCQTGGATHAARMELDADHAAPPTARQEPRGTAEPRADVEHAGRRAHARPPRQDVDRGDPAVVVLVEVEQVLGREASGGTTGGGGADVDLVDRMAVVEVDGSGSLP
jgi:hypothetical protein